MKIVLDTNVLINGFKDEYSFEKRIMDEVIAGKIEAFANKQTLRENKLLSGQIIDNTEYQNQLNNFFAQINWVINRRQINIVSDPQDNKILESAVEAKADYLITSDNDLLKLVKYQNIKIATPAEFWNQYKDEGMDLWKQWTDYLKKDK
ncbi:MAG: putative toxin-antitoxin system toxin component, PIN family [Candidatus Doudnabacteria bacterium]|nr:putative toxin-antitoxin system toxin component, PIN family [Candidatus Doudnabacteria bacterium]